ncbi:hypothetical protein PHJA_001265800 [Phtheirospermum japonicum]|uniref:Uncharacterized protein n=1 Tax=Phtheirospermum japonicum TaxID=374723 RepID=A0A830C259_9LAMI|nr:hypothetical protein PHJA_001265800 [Phtheirospermum japonicum]
MNGIWVSLKGSMNCGSKITDVAKDKMPRLKSSSTSSSDTTLHNEPTDKDENPFVQPKSRHYYIKNRFHELGIGDPSRNIVEMIFRASSSNPTRCSRKVNRVLKVNNSVDILAKFEKYRETVMLSSYENHKRHPRSTVDGNEVLQFYGTTMSCCGSRQAEQVSQLCPNPCCRVCRIIQSGFNTCYNKKYGIRLSMNSEHASEDNTAFVKGKKAKKAVFICRTIVGGVAGVESGESEHDDEFVGDGLCTKPEFLILWNSAAVLPCFVLVFG